MILKQTDKEIFTKAHEAFNLNYPKLVGDFDFNNTQSLFSHFSLKLPRSILTRVQSLVKDYYFLKNQQAFQDMVLNSKLRGLKASSFKPSVLCCFDFHYHADQDQLKLIEINTNASSYLVGLLANQAHGLETSDFKTSLFSSFENAGLLEGKKLYIMDASPKKEKMYLEFLLYKEELSKKNISAEIIETHLLEEQASSINSKDKINIYNRDTDFYLEKSPQLWQAFKNLQVKLSPHPLDYDLMAKKTNLEKLYKFFKTPTEHPTLNAALQNTELSSLKDSLLQSGLVQNDFQDIEELRTRKKSLFFKPAMSFGSKATYKGASVTKRVLEEIWQNNMLYQEHFPAGQFRDEQEQKWKYDLRFYTYQGQVQFYLARVYQGQVTNFKSHGGGLAPVVFD